MSGSDARATFEVERRTTISASPEAIFRQLEDFHHWAAWSPWEDKDPNLQRTYAGSESGVGARYEWIGNRKAGEGRMVIAEVQSPSDLTITIEFFKPFKSEGTVRFVLDPEGDGTRVTWSMTGPKTFGTRVMGLFMSMDKAIGPDFEKGLARLKAVAEG